MIMKTLQFCELRREVINETERKKNEREEKKMVKKVLVTIREQEI